MINRPTKTAIAIKYVIWFILPNILPISKQNLGFAVHKSLISPKKCDNIKPMGHKNYEQKIEQKIESDAKKRFFVESANIGKVVIDGEEHNHLANVMRFKVGDQVILVCNDNFDYIGKIEEILKNFSVVNVFEKKENTSNPQIDITAFVAMNKREQTSLMVRMLSEIGVSTFVPMITKYTLPQDTTEKIERYQKIADQSAKQCRRSLTLKIEKPQKLDDVINQFKNFDAVFFAYENEDKFVLKKFDKPCKKIAFLVGPVAGFDKTEATKIVGNGAVSVSLGKRILREETACVALASILVEKFEN